ncbi:MAG: flippase [Patescibacteria group bacterium]
MLDKLFQTIEKITPQKYRWILSHDGFKRYFANTGWMFFGQMFSLLVSFFIVAWLARYLGPENYGVLSYAVAFVGVFSFIATLGVDGILARDLVKFPERRDKLLGTAFGLKIIGGIFAFILSTLTVIIFSTSFMVRLLVILLSFSFIIQTINVVSIYFQAEVKSKNNTKSLLVATIVSSILKISVIFFHKGIIWIAIISVLDSIWLGIGFLVAYKSAKLKISNWHFDRSLAKEILKNSWPLMLASVAGFIYLRIDQIMVGAFMGNRAVGLYAVAVRLVEVWYFIPGIICGSLLPAIINAKKTSAILYKNRLRKFYILMTIIPVALAIPISFLAKPIVLTLFGSSFFESINILRIYIWSSIGVFLGMAANQYLMSENLVKTIFWLNFSAMVVNVGLNFIFIPSFGLLGAVIATLISCFVIPGATFLIRRKI